MATRKVETGKTEITIEELKDLLNSSQNYLSEMRDMLKDIKVAVTKDNPQVLEAIRNIFGMTYLSEDGLSAYVTFDMFLECMEITRNVGRATAAEFA